MSSRKTCRDCGKTYPVSEFPRRSSGHRQARCVPCQRRYNTAKSARAYHREAPEKRAARNRRTALRRWHGITPEQFDAMSDAQGGRCAICGDVAPLHVDHCHRTRVIRALLCSPCNTAIGLLKEDPARLRRAAEYLERPAPTDALVSRPAMPSGVRP